MAKRAGWIGLVLALAAGAVLVLLDRHVAALVLTLTAAVGIINALWLEQALTSVLQPGRPRVSRRAIVLVVARLALWGLLFAVIYVLRRQVDLWAVAAGMGCFLLALALEGLRSGGEKPGEE